MNIWLNALLYAVMVGFCSFACYRIGIRRSLHDSVMKRLYGGINDLNQMDYPFLAISHIRVGDSAAFKTMEEAIAYADFMVNSSCEEHPQTDFVVATLQYIFDAQKIQRPTDPNEECYWPEGVKEITNFHLIQVYPPNDRS